MSRTLMKPWGLCCCIALLTIACKKKDTSQIPDSFEACVTELVGAQEFAKSGLEGVAPDQVESVVGARLDRIGIACQPIFVEKVCSQAVANMKQALGGGATWIEVCRNAFCADASDHAACQTSAEGATMLEAIWSKDWGAKSAVVMRKRVESLGLDPKDINALLMKQVNKIFAAPIKIDMQKLRGLKKEDGPAITKTMTVKLSESGILLEGDGIESVSVEATPALADALKTISSAGVAPQTTGVNILGSETTSYQEMVSVMDQLVVAGFQEIFIGSSTDDAEQVPKTSVEDLKESAVVTISKTSISVDGKKVGELSEGAEVWRVAMVAALKAGHPGASALILQADKEALYTTIVAVIDSARPAGFVEVMFAVIRKK